MKNVVNAISTEIVFGFVMLTYIAACFVALGICAPDVVSKVCVIMVGTALGIFSIWLSVDMIKDNIADAKREEVQAKFKAKLSEDTDKVNAIVADAKSNAEVVEKTIKINSFSTDNVASAAVLSEDDKNRAARCIKLLTDYVNETAYTIGNRMDSLDKVFNIFYSINVTDKELRGTIISELISLDVVLAAYEDFEKTLENRIKFETKIEASVKLCEQMFSKIA